MKKTLKKYLAALLALISVMACAVIPASALGGYAGDAMWEIKDGTLTVYGGNIPSYSAAASAPWQKFADRVKTLVIGSGVSIVGERAFEDMTSLTSVELGGVSSVGTMAFSGCLRLRSVTLPDTVISLGDFAFAECSALTGVQIPPKLATFGNGVFEACLSLSQFKGGSTRYTVDDGVLCDSVTMSVVRCPQKRSKPYTVPSGITNVAAGAFRDCTLLPSADLSGVTSIGDGAFSGSAALANINIPDAKTIGMSAFYGCAVERITLGAALTSIGDRAFEHCAALSLVELEGDAPAGGTDIFYGVKSGFVIVVQKDAAGYENDRWLGYPVIRHGIYSGNIGEISWKIDSETGVMTVEGACAMPDFENADEAPWYIYRKLVEELRITGVTAIGKNSFRYLGIRELSLPESVKRIGAHAFSACTALTRVDAPAVTEVGDAAFLGCTALVRSKLPSVEKLGAQSFSGCTSLWYTATGKNAPVLGEYAFDLTDAVVVYPVGGVGYSGGGWDEVENEPYSAGDADGDGKCNITDVILLLKYIAKWDVSVNRISADVNGDRKCNVTDVTLMLRHIAKWDIEFGIEI